MALKVIEVPPGAGNSEVVRERFLREARAAAALRHPNVAAVYHFGTVPEPDRCYYAMELVEGETLEARVRREGPLKVAQVLEIGVQVTRALIVAANQGLIHRDLKPANIMLTRSEDSSAGFEVKVIDFGLAKVTAESFGERDLTHGGFVGTPSYASPEQFAGGRVDARSDIYSLGSSLWFALTGRLPCAGTNVEEIRRCQTETPLPVQQLVARKVPAPVIELLRSMLAIEPDERPASARELMEAIENCQSKLTRGNETARPSFFAELKRRNVYKVAIAYGVVAWLLMQVASQIFPFFEIPSWAVRLVVLALIIGFPVALILAWAFELTPEGIKREEDVDLGSSITRKTGRKLDFFIIAVLVLVIGLLLFQRLHHNVPPAVFSSLEKSIAVLPFENRSEEKQNAYFADGVQDEILTDLAKVADLKVISRTSVMQYKSGAERNVREIGHQLGVAHLVEGSVQRAGNRVRVNAQLIDARTDAHLWAQTYDRDLADIFAIQSEIAQAIANQLQAKMSAGEKAAIEERPTNDLVAYDLYVRATALADAADPPSQEHDADLLREAVKLLNEAIARDPAFLLAYCKLGQVQDAIYFHGFDHTATRLALAKDAIDSAFRVKPDSDEAHLVLARHLYRGYLDYDNARDELAIAARTLPNDARVFQLSGEIDRRQGRWRDAVRDFQRASELDPQNADHLEALRETYRMMRAYKQARETADRRLALKSNAIPPTLRRFQIDLEERADTRPLHAVLEKTLRNNPAVAGSIVADRFILALYERDFAAADRVLASLTDREFGETKPSIYFNRAIAQGVIAHAKGDTAAAHDAFAAARPEVEKAESEDPSHGGTHAVLGFVYAGCGLKEQALREGRRALELTPVAKNAVDGAGVLYFFAVICAWTGERDLAFEQLETLAKIPAGASYGELRLDPSWDSLRGDPRFEKIVASLAPKETVSK